MRTTRLAFPAALLSSLLVTMHVTVLAAPAWAQGLPGAELFAGYSYLRIDAGADPGGLFSGETRGLQLAPARAGSRRLASGASSRSCTRWPVSRSSRRSAGIKDASVLT